MIKHRQDNTKDMKKWMEQGGADKMPVKLSPRPGENFDMGSMYTTSSRKIIDMATSLADSFKGKRSSTTDRDSADPAASPFFRPASRIRADTMAGRNSMMLNRMTSPRITSPRIPSPRGGITSSKKLPPISSKNSNKTSNKNITSMKDLYNMALSQQQTHPDDVYLDDTDDDDEDAEYINDEDELSFYNNNNDDDDEDDNEGSKFTFEEAEDHPLDLNESTLDFRMAAPFSSRGVGGINDSKGSNRSKKYTAGISPRPSSKAGSGTGTGGGGISPRLGSFFGSLGGFGGSMKSGGGSPRGTGTGNNKSKKSPRGGPKDK